MALHRHILPQRLLKFPSNLSFYKVLQLPAILEFCEEVGNMKGDMSGGFAIWLEFSGVSGVYMIWKLVP